MAKRTLVQRGPWDQTAEAALERIEPDDPQRYDVDVAEPEPVDGGPTTVYYLHDADHQLLYVGVSASRLGTERFSRHAHDKDWWPQVAYISLEHLPTRQSALAREFEAIASLRPRYNVKSGHRMAAGVQRTDCACEAKCGYMVEAVVGEQVHANCRKRMQRERQRKARQQ